MIDLSKYRIIDLSLEIVPGERRIDGRYLHGEPRWGRPLEVQEFIAYEARMHFIQGQTHCGTHAEGMYKYDENGPDMASMPLESYLGEAAACNFTHKKAGEAVTIDDFKKAGVKTGDIVLAWGSAETAEARPMSRWRQSTGSPRRRSSSSPMIISASRRPAHPLARRTPTAS